MSRLMLTLGLVAALVAASLSGGEAAQAAQPAASRASVARVQVYGPYPYARAVQVQRALAEQGYQTKLVHGAEGYLVEAW